MGKDMGLRTIGAAVVLTSAMLLCACAAGQSSDDTEPRSAATEQSSAAAKPARTYELVAAHQVAGRQGVCTDGAHYWVSGSTSLAKYDTD